MPTLQCFIELPADKFGNTAYLYHRGDVVVQGYIEPDSHGDPIIHVTAPADFPWPRLPAARWLPVDHAPGAISPREWAALLLAADLPDWVHQVAHKIQEAHAPRATNV